MNRSRVVCILLMAICSLAKGQDLLIKVTDEPGAFQASFPVNPVKSIQLETLPAGTLTWTVLKADYLPTENRRYLVKYTDLPSTYLTSDSLSKLNGFFVMTQNDLGTTLEDRMQINLLQIQGYPGREFIWIDDSENLGYARRVFVVGCRVYMLEVQYRLENAHNENIERFLNSFSLLRTSNNQHPEALPEKPIKLFTASFPGLTALKDDPTHFELFGNIFVVQESYGVPPEQRDLPTVKNLLYAVNYAKLPESRLKSLNDQQLKKFLTDALVGNIEKGGGKILLNRDLPINGGVGIEVIGRILGGQLVMHIKSFIVQGYYYQVAVLSKNGLENNKESGDFLDSFKLSKSN